MLNNYFLKNTTIKHLTIICLLLLLLPFVSTDYFLSLIGKVLIFAIFAISLDLAWGYGGILSLGHSVFFGLGSYAFAITALQWDSSVSIALGVVLGIALPALLALVVSMFLFFTKSSLFYIGVITLSLSLLAEQVALRFPQLTGGQNGLNGLPGYPLSGIPLYFVIFFFFVSVLYLSYKFLNSNMGKVVVAVRDNEERTRFMGYKTAWVRTLMFVLSGTIAGLAGVLYAPYSGFVSPSLLNFVLATQVIVWVAIGGRGKLVGAVIGALLINILEPYFIESFPYVWQVLLGLLFVFVVVFMPNGLYSLLNKKTSDKENQYQVVVKPPSQSKQHGNGILNIQNLKVSFGSLNILKGIDLKLNSGELLCIIGPNGAGKSTLINSLTGRNIPTGAVELEGQRIENKKPEDIVRLGIARTFQSTNIIGSLTVAENLQLAAGKGKFPSFFKRTNTLTLTPSAEQLLRQSGLSEKLSVEADNLVHGDQQLLELCMSIALEPKVLFLDEPTAGLTLHERRNIGKMLTQLARKDNISLLVIEHDVDFVKEISDRVTVLHDGTIMADGTVQDVTGNELVKRVYLGGRAT
ncbi:branched-chain amino acid ABC transporter ATP-binding protein/permease [Bacillus sp. Marseille-P3661]|uniref:branched-chain amino acid ABC transporter ATP-binding protein/permease n=1 Tax=Bacillus sp. Marseille-P3661 TaxID=1936234 RepID=UPI0015E1A3BA|nr:ATP-binding cassette domain-containing protein [Bacillus sp. Marseille-P3661]